MVHDDGLWEAQVPAMPTSARPTGAGRSRGAAPSGADRLVAIAHRLSDKCAEIHLGGHS